MVHISFWAVIVGVDRVFRPVYIIRKVKGLPSMESRVLISRVF